MLTEAAGGSHRNEVHAACYIQSPLKDLNQVFLSTVIRGASALNLLEILEFSLKKWVIFTLIKWTSGCYPP